MKYWIHPFMELGSGYFDIGFLPSASRFERPSNPTDMPSSAPPSISAGLTKFITSEWEQVTIQPSLCLTFVTLKSPAGVPATTGPNDKITSVAFSTAESFSLTLPSRTTQVPFSKTTQLFDDAFLMITFQTSIIFSESDAILFPRNPVERSGRSFQLDPDLLCAPWSLMLSGQVLVVKLMHLAGSSRLSDINSDNLRGSDLIRVISSREVWARSPKI